MVPQPVTTPSPGILVFAMPKSVQRCSTYMSNSSNEPSSRSRSMRSRAVSLPRLCCAAIRASPPPSFATSRRRCSSPRMSFMAGRDPSGQEINRQARCSTRRTGCKSRARPPRLTARVQIRRAQVRAEKSPKEGDATDRENGAPSTGARLDAGTRTVTDGQASDRRRRADHRWTFRQIEPPMGPGECWHQRPEPQQCCQGINPARKHAESQQQEEARKGRGIDAAPGEYLFEDLPLAVIVCGRKDPLGTDDTGSEAESSPAQCSENGHLITHGAAPYAHFSCLIMPR